LELVHGDLQLFFGALQLRLGHSDEFLVGEGRKEELRGRRRHLVALVDESGIGGVLGGGGGALVGESLEAVEQVQAQPQRARVRCVRGHRHDLPRRRVVPAG